MECISARGVPVSGNGLVLELREAKKRCLHLGDYVVSSVRLQKVFEDGRVGDQHTFFRGMTVL